MRVLRQVRGRCTLENESPVWAQGVVVCGAVAAAGALVGSGFWANTPLKLTWLNLGASRRHYAHCSLSARQRGFPHPPSSLTATVRRRLRRQASGKDEKEGHTQAIMRPSFKRMGP